MLFCFCPVRDYFQSGRESLGYERNKPSFIRYCFLGVLLLLLAFSLPATGLAQDYYFEFSPPSSETKFIRHTAGRTVSIETRFNPATNSFLWIQKYVPADGTGNLPDGLNLVLSNGFMPKGRQGEVAVLFFDASDLSNPSLSAYAYNGFNSDTSWEHADLAQSLSPDPIISSRIDPTWINDLRAFDSGGTRTFIIDIDTTAINSHSPLASSLNPWLGVSFGQYIGIWAHSISGSSASYDANGFLTSKSSGTLGYVDLNSARTSGCDLGWGLNFEWGFDSLKDSGLATGSGFDLVWDLSLA